MEETFYFVVEATHMFQHWFQHWNVLLADETVHVELVNMDHQLLLEMFGGVMGIQ